MADAPKPDPNPMADSEKLAIQAETGAGRTMARPAGSQAADSGLQPGSTSPNNAAIGGDRGPLGAASGNTGGAGTLAGSDTNDSMPEGGATGDKMQPDTVAPTLKPGSR